MFKAVVLAGGFSTRLKSLSGDLPKGKIFSRDQIPERYNEDLRVLVSQSNFLDIGILSDYIFGCEN